MKRLLLFTLALAALPVITWAQCTTTNATSCQCATSGSTNCDLLPDMIVARPPLLTSGNNGIIEYSQTGNGSNNGLLRISVSTPNIGHGPLEVHATNRYVCGLDTITGTAPTTCPNTGLPPKQLIQQRVYHKNGNTMTYTDRDAGSMTYHPTHGHMHVDDWGKYSLRTMTNDPNPLNWPIVGNGAKLAFCLMDYGSCSTYNGHCVDSSGNTLTNGNFPNYGLGGGAFNCSPTVQGISSGWTDIYYQYLDGMWITIPPGTCNGQYYIVVQLDPYNYFLEEHENNNIIVIPYTLTQQAGATPTITTGGATNLCAGTSVELTSTAAGNYQWSNGATTRTITVSAPGTYTVTTNVGSACSASSTPVTVTTQTMPVTVSATPPAVCTGTNVALHTTVTAPSTGTVQANFTNNTVFSIPDNNTNGVVSPVTVAGISPTTLSATSVFSVQVNITHTYDSDLKLELISPGGISIKLCEQRGGSGDNFNNTVFRMTGSDGVGNGSAPFIGTFIPEQSFSLLTGNVNGTWNLKVSDVVANDVGTLNTWTLKLNNNVPTQLTYSWTSVPSGFTSTAANPTAGPTANTTYNVTVNNTTNGCSTAAGTAVTVSTVAPGTPSSIQGTARPCPGSNYTFSVTNNTAVSSYTWVPPANTSIVSGQGTNSIVLAVNASFMSGSLCVTGSNACGTSASRCKSISRDIPSTPSAITGTAKPCPGTTTTYSVTNNAGYTYTWVPPANTSVISGQGTNAITLSVGANFNTGSLCVTAANTCGASPSRCLTISKNTTPTPGTVQGNYNGICQTNTTITVPPVTGAVSYTWTLPANTNLVSGQGTNSLTFSTNASFVSGQVCVTATNGCIVSAARCITAYAAPSKPVVTGASVVCVNQMGVPYSITPVFGATGYNWTAPTGSTIASGQGTTSATVNFGSTTGKVSCYASNTCGSRNGSVNITFNCRLAENASTAFDVAIVPNPAMERTEIVISGASNEKVVLTLTNILGKEVLRKTYEINQDARIPLDLSDLSSGVYMVSVQQDATEKHVRLVVD